MRLTWATKSGDSLPCCHGWQIQLASAPQKLGAVHSVSEDDSATRYHGRHPRIPSVLKAGGSCLDVWCLTRRIPGSHSHQTVTPDNEDPTITHQNIFLASSQEHRPQPRRQRRGVSLVNKLSVRLQMASCWAHWNGVGLDCGSLGALGGLIV